MLDYWQSGRRQGVDSINEDSLSLTLNVLSHVALGSSHPFQGDKESFSSTEAFNCRNAFSVLLQNVFVLAGVPRLLLDLPLVPSKWTRVARIRRAPQGHIMSMIYKEKALVGQKELRTGNLLTALVGNSQGARNLAIGTPESKHVSESLGIQQGLSDTAILSNIFIFMIAGHETTGHALTYSILRLAACPQWQDWIAEEICEMTGNTHDTAYYDYEVLFPRLRRCRAVMVVILACCVFSR